jgi:hypothetical protein
LVVLTTQSPHFVDLGRPENLVLVSKQDGEATRVVQRTWDELRIELVTRRGPGEDTARNDRPLLRGERDNGHGERALRPGGASSSATRSRSR